VIEEKIDSDIEEVIPELANSQEWETIWASDTDSDDFTVNDLVIGNEYSWYVKLKYNYGLFVTVYGVEWLLHKNFILSPEWVSWKKLYEIGDPIMVKAMEFKEIEWEKRVVRTQI
jgi:ribosomal protein S1